MLLFQMIFTFRNRHLIETDTNLTPKPHLSGMTDLKGLSKTKLLALAEEHELAIGGTKAELLARIEAHLESLEEVEPVVEEVEEVVEEVEEVVEEVAVPELVEEVEAETSGLAPEDFVKSAFKEVLKREADAGGLQHYTVQLMAHGWSEEQIIADLKESSEYKSL